MSIDQFGKSIIAAGLMAADELKTFWSSIPAAERPKDARGLAELLVRGERLTRFQASELLSQSTTPLVLGDYVLLEKIGAGGMGQVFRARHRHMDRLAAIKLLPSTLMKDEAAVKRFQREVKAAAKLAHPNIVQAFDASVQRGVWYLVMEHIAGRDLEAFMREHGALPGAAAVDYILQAARGLAYAHAEGVIHRDIKPANLLLDRKGNVKILDMGLARFDTSADAADNQLTASGVVMGTVDYMPPEQAQSTHDCDARSDIYSLGCSLYRLLTCDSVYHGASAVKKILAHMHDPVPSLCAKRPDVPAEIDRIFRKMIAKAPDHRYQTADALVADLEAWCREQDAAAEASGAPSDDQDSKLSEFFRSIEQIGGTRHGVSGATALAPAPIAATQSALQPTLSRMTAEVVTSAHAARATPTFSAKTGTIRRLTLDRGKPPVAVLASIIGGFAVVLLLGIWLIIRDKDGNEVARVKVPDGGSFEQLPTKLPSPRAGAGPGVRGSAPGVKGSTSPLAAADPHRAAAEAVLSTEGSLQTVTVVTADAEKQIGDLAELPAEPFALVGINHLDAQGSLSRLIDAVLPIHSTLDTLRIARAHGGTSELYDRDLKKLSDLNCRYLNLSYSHLTDASVTSFGPEQSLVRLELAATKAGDEACRVISTSPTLVALNLRGTPITADGLKALEHCQALNALELGSNSLTAKDLTSIQNIAALRFLTLTSAGIGDEILDGLVELKQLRVIDLDNTRVSEEGVRRLQKLLTDTHIHHRAAELAAIEKEIVQMALSYKAAVYVYGGSSGATRIKIDEPIDSSAYVIQFSGGPAPADEARKLAQSRSLQQLYWPNLDDGADDAILHLAKVTTLTSLRLPGCGLSGTGLAHLSSLTPLRELELSRNERLDDQSLSHLPALLSLEKLDLSFCPIKGPGLEQLERAPHLQRLSLGAMPLETDGLRHLLKLKYLRSLVLNDTPIDDAAVPHLSRCTSLRRLSVRGTKLTKRGINQLHQALPNCIIQWDGPLVRPEPLTVALTESTSATDWGLGNTPNPAAALHRRAAEAVLAAGGTVRIATASSDYQTVRKAADLPGEPFAVLGIDIAEPQQTLTSLINVIAPIQQTLDQFVNRGEAVLSQQDLGKLPNLNCEVVYLMRTSLTDASAKFMARWVHLRHVDLYETDIGDETCRMMANWPALTSLNLARTPITDDGLQALESCPLLNHLTLQGCQAITDKGLASLERMPHLQALNLRSTSFGDGIVDVLGAARQLRYINLHDTAISDDGVRRLQTLLPRTFIDHPAVELPPAEQELVRWAVSQQARVLLKDGSYAKSDEPVRSAAETIDFSAASPPASDAARLAEARCLRRLIWRNLSGADEAIVHLAKIDSLIGLYLVGADLSGEGLSRLSALKSLCAITLDGCQRIDDAALSQFPELPALQDLRLYGCPITGAGLELLPRLPRLVRLSLSATPLESAALAHLSRQKHLQRLSLDQTPIDDAAVPHLSQCSSLRRLVVRNTKLTKRGIDQLHQALPHCIIQWDRGLVLPAVENGRKPQAAKTSNAGSGKPGEPPHAVVPFDAKQARAHQVAWAKHLGVEVEMTNSAGAKMVLIPPGEFLMGSTDEQVEAALKLAVFANADEVVRNQIQTVERPQHRVIIDKPFLIGATEVTIGQFKKFAATGYRTEAEKLNEAGKSAAESTSGNSEQPATAARVISTWSTPGYPVEDSLPVAAVSWNDAQAYCNWLSQQEKATYRLATEAEWEYACRAGTKTPYFFGDDETRLDSYGWFRENTKTLQPVAGKEPNSFGLYDMYGNLWEWCQDYLNNNWYEKRSSSGPPTGGFHVLRGGSWAALHVHCRSAYRHGGEPSAYANNRGFRVVRVVDDLANADH